MSFSKEPVAFLGLGFFITCNLHRTIRRGDLVGIFTFEKYSITFFHPNFNSSTKCWVGGGVSFKPFRVSVEHFPKQPVCTQQNPIFGPFGSRRLGTTEVTKHRLCGG